MHPIEVMEVAITIILFFVVITISFFIFKKKKIVFSIIFIYVLMFILFVTIRPTYIDYTIEQKVTKLNIHLTEKYPNETWTIWTVPHRESQYKSMNPYIIEVTFTNEPTEHYGFSINKDNIQIVTHSGKHNTNQLKHYK